MNRALVHGIICFMAKPVFIALKKKRENSMWQVRETWRISQLWVNPFGLRCDGPWQWVRYSQPEPPEITFYFPWPHIQHTHWQILAFPPQIDPKSSTSSCLLAIVLVKVPAFLDPRRRALPNWTGTWLALSLLGAPALHHLMGLSQTFSHLDMCGMAILKSPVVTHQMAQARATVWGPEGARACSQPEVWGKVFWFPFYCTHLVPSPSVCIREAPATDTVMP